MTGAIGLDDPLTVLPRVGPAIAALYEEEIDVRTVGELIAHWPRRHRDLGDLSSLEEAEIGEQVTLVGTITAWRRVPVRKRKLTIDEGTVETPNGGVFQISIFNRQWVRGKHGVGTTAAFAGKLELFRSRVKLNNPDIEPLDHADDVLGGRLRPLYPATSALPSGKIGTLVRTALELLGPLEEWVDEVTCATMGLVDHDTAVRAMHDPPDREALQHAIRRLKFDELYTLQLGLRWRRARLEADVVGLDNGPVAGGRAEAYLAGLPFDPTGAQQQAMTEIGGDLGGRAPMHRLLQGDVGSGKTIVAVWAMLCAVDNGHQAAMMVPTEVLAEQHYATLLGQLSSLGVNVLDGPRVACLTGSTPASEQRRILSQLLTGELDIVVGTHALLEEEVRFADLGLVVIDEQHRFGVEQRVTIRDKRLDVAGERSAVDVLVMTATPIPRSLSLTVYGDLEVTVLDELPPGRKPIVTQLITPVDHERRTRLVNFVRERAGAGEQTYWVCPLVDPSDAIEAASATEMHARLDREVFPDLTVGLVHGQMASSEKDEAMRAFRAGEVDVLVATTVIEVGVDVPKATIMVIEDAERFGISQLHQLRGRVGRGGDRSYCVLFAGWAVVGHDYEPGDRAAPKLEDLVTKDAMERLEAVAETVDGFALAERDLLMRGSGTLFGTRQSGVQDLRLATITDLDLIRASRRAAARTIEEDPDLERYAPLAEMVRRRHRGLEQFAALETG